MEEFFSITNKAYLNVANCIVTESKANNGGLISSFNYSTSKLSYIRSFTSVGHQNGGVIYSENNDNIHVENSNFFDSQSQRGGFLFQTKQSFIEMKRCTFNEGKALNGGFVHTTESTLSMISNNISNLVAIREGGTFYVNNSNISMNNCNLVDTHSTILGGTGVMYGISEV
jgi:hypothetical protein